ncbi:Aste57867_315 [Aphanomyces stellatus]|uniref:Aste57867_315 protein n=1 Tax=Aphanomyces stellatus TaxID=120398 RepID=A0A485K794_9STRA|nr:hypothetical protein As57867_000315 [Aphanomyces stellatus]VFT77541.1 Aste57867_315 [Aphanomyces stellatus]
MFPVSALLLAIAATTQAYTPSCGALRAPKAGDTVYISIDDGPGSLGRPFLLDALDQLNSRTDADGTRVTPVAVSFFDCGYNFCGDNFRQGNCSTYAFENAQQLLARTIKAGHMVGAHTDTHFTDPTTYQCDYIKMIPPTQIQVEPKFAACGTDAASDFVRGALRIDQALRDPYLWGSSKAEVARQHQAIQNLWSFVRTPCTNAWRLPGVNKTIGLPSWLPAESAARLATIDQVSAGSLACRPPAFQGKPWHAIGWDAEWWLNPANSPEQEKCTVVANVLNTFENPAKAGPGNQSVVLLTHDWLFTDYDKAAIFQNVVAELQARGYALSSVDKYKY